MNSYARMVRWLIWGFLALVILGTFAAYLSKLRPKSESDLSSELREPALANMGSKAGALPIYSKIGNFALTNQLEQTITADTLSNHVWVANVIFTRCAGPCIRLTRQMQQLQTALTNMPVVRFVSFTADPAWDTPPVLHKFADRFGADHQRWFFLTGKKKDVYRFITEQLKLPVLDKEQDRQPDEDMFVHTEKFVIIDGSGQIRAYIDGDEPESISKIIAAVSALRKEKQA